MPSPPRRPPTRPGPPCRPSSAPRRCWPRSRALPRTAMTDAAILSQENGKIRLEGWVDSLVLELRWKLALSHADEVNASKVLPPIPGAIPVETTVAYQPLGVVTIIVPFNWPIAILGAALPHALLAGNTVIVKPPLTAPLATARVVQRIAEQLPPGVLNVVTGAGREHERTDPQPRRRQGVLHRLGQRRQEDHGTGLAQPHARHPGTGRQRCGHRPEGRDHRRRAPGPPVRGHLRHHRPDLHERQAAVRAQVAHRRSGQGPVRAPAEGQARLWPRQGHHHGPAAFAGAEEPSSTASSRKRRTPAPRCWNSANCRAAT